jgi:protein-disulfide isomerase-like protein with CxxC motif
MKNLLLGSSLGLALLVGGLAQAQMASPKENVNQHRHPNLAAAQRLSEQAFAKINAAQQANEFDMDGHAAKAKDLLDQANRELKQAAEAANANKNKMKPQ